MDALLSVGVLVSLGAIAVISYVAFRRGNVPAMVNALVSVCLVLVPVFLDVIAYGVYELSLGLTPELPLWIGVVGVAHSYGMLGVYDDVWWWDHLTHTLSASLVAALVYAAVIVSVDHGGISVTGSLVWAAVVTVTLLAGVFWELIELLSRDVERQFGVTPVLDHYGRRDTILDLCFDVVGALLVLIVDVRTFVSMATVAPTATVTALVWSVGLLIVGSLVTSLIVVMGQSRTT